MSSPLETGICMLLGLPRELIERILIACAGVEPVSIAAFGQCSRYTDNIVNRAVDSFLWRAVFLAVFDDPRRGARVAQVGGYGAAEGDLPAYDWVKEFKQRMLARKRILSTTENSDPAHCASTMGAISDTLASAQPFPSSAVLSFGSDTPSSLPPFPPIVVVLHSLPALPDVFSSKNTPWLESALFSRGYPETLTKMLLFSAKDPIWGRSGSTTEWALEGLGKRTRSKRYWEQSEESRSLNKWIMATGFIPVPSNAPLPDVVAGHQDVEDLFADEPVERMSFPVGPPTQQEQLARARTLARRRVYDLNYLTSERAWGPFLPPQQAERIRNQVASTTRNFDWDGNQDIEDDSFTLEQEEEQEEDALDAQRRAQLLPLLFGAFANDPPNDAPPIDPDRVLYPDYAYLAAIRLVIESNLSHMVQDAEEEEDEDNDSTTGAPPGSSVGGGSQAGGGIEGRASVRSALVGWVGALRRLECARMGGSAGYWYGRGIQDILRPEDTVEARELRQAKPPRSLSHETVTTHVSNEDEGWDWAGVEGDWRRCVSWMDYRDLVTQNVNQSSTRFDEPGIHETLRIIPMKLWIVGYSWPSVKAGRRRLPTIHCEGETVSEARTRRKVVGTVSVIGDDAVRWSLVSNIETDATGNDEDIREWVTEGIQIGDIGSAAGVLGMWTGANHTRLDPLGPSWAWKVGLLESTSHRE